MNKMMLDRRKLIGSAGAVCCLAGMPACVRSPEPSAAAAIQAAIERRVAAGQLPGAVVALGEGVREPVYIAGGTKEFDSSAPVDRHTLWRLASMTKPVAGMAIMMLIGDGLLGLDQPVADFIPAFAEMTVLPDGTEGPAVAAESPVTVRHLLTHTSGVTRVPEGGTANAPAPATLGQYVDRLAAMPLAAQPGEKWIYAAGLEIAARLIEVVSGVSFDAFLQRRLFAPLDMRSTYFMVPDRDRDRLVTLYAQRDGQLAVTDPAATSRFLKQPPFPRAAGGLVSSARDYDRFLSMILGHGTLDGVEVMSPAMVRLGTSNLLPAGADMSDFPLSSGPSGFGAGGAVSIDGPRPGTYGWAGFHGTTAFVDTIRRERWSTYSNVGISDFGREINELAGKTI